MLLVGPTGTGKTAYTLSYLASLDPERYVPPNVLGFSAQTSANMAQALVDAKLDKRRKVRCASTPCHCSQWRCTSGAAISSRAQRALIVSWLRPQICCVLETKFGVLKGVCCNKSFSLMDHGCCIFLGQLAGWRSGCGPGAPWTVTRGQGAHWACAHQVIASIRPLYP